MTDSVRLRTEQLRFGVVGLGVAFNFLAKSIADRPHLRFTAACDLRRGALDKFAADYGGETYTDVAELCRSPNIDAVYVVTPNRLHRDQVITAADHGKHVIVDKPMAVTLEECEAMNRAAERNGVMLLCGHMHSYDPSIRKMREIVAGGSLGPLRMINTWHFNDWIYRPRAPWELEPGQGGNLIFNQGSHQVDIVRLIGGGMVRSVRAMTGIWDPARKIEGAYAAYLEFEDGTAATLVYNSYAHFDTAELTNWIGEGSRTPEQNPGARKRLADLQRTGGEAASKEAWRYGGERAFNPPEAVLDVYGFTVASCERGDVRQTPEGLVVHGDDAQFRVPVDATTNSSNGALENLYDAVFLGKPVLRDGRWGQATIEVLLAIMQSARERKEIYLERQVPSSA